MVCKGVECIRLKAKKPVGVGRYSSGQKRCNVCEVFINFNGNRCPCCSTKLRGKPRELKYKDKYRASEKEKFGIDMKDD